MTAHTIAELVADAGAIGDEAERVFTPLPIETMHGQPAPGAWSAAQCLEHLIRSNAAYFPAFEATARGEYRPGPAARLPFLPRLWGRLIYHVVRPESARKVRTAARFDPRPDAVDRDVLRKFLDCQARLIDLMTRLQGVNVARVRVVSPFAGFIAYSVVDACTIIVAHERRHLAQAEAACKAVKKVEGVKKDPP